MKIVAVALKFRRKFAAENFGGKLQRKTSAENFSGKLQRKTSADYKIHAPDNIQ
jgi:hypothetical protein